MSKFNGKVKSFNKTKGFGFITSNEGEDIFFHFSDLVMDGFKTIDPEVEVEYSVITTDRGKQAKDIEPK